MSFLTLHVLSKIIDKRLFFLQKISTEACKAWNICMTVWQRREYCVKMKLKCVHMMSYWTWTIRVFYGNWIYRFFEYKLLLFSFDSHILYLIIFRQILTYRREMRESMQVKFALSLFSCFKNGNYIRFFKLLKRNASYLQVYNFLQWSI